ncbi:hypothetical protein ACHAW6_011363 [Cyclotella cf. meneghiniana]
MPINKFKICKQYPMPIIIVLFCKCSGYKFFTKLDISMQYYSFELDEFSQNLCIIITPFGKYKFLMPPMGLKCSPDIAQSIMESIFARIDDADIYFDDFGVFSQTWNHHIEMLGNILHGLHENGFAINHSNVNGPSQKLTGWVIGFLHGV